MLKRHGMIAIGLIAVLAGFGWGVAELFKLRFASGDVYPAYSSLRADPLGTKAYFEALHTLGGPVTRNLSSPLRFEDAAATTAFYFAIPHDDLTVPEHEFRTLDGFVRNGGRLVLTLYPHLSGTRWITSSTNINQQRGEIIDISGQWGFSVTLGPVPRDSRGDIPRLKARALTANLPEVSWHSALVMTNVGLEWRIVYARDSEPVMIERQLGAGSLVIATDSYFVSNEALQSEREAGLLTWLAGSGDKVIFDEVHLGVREQPGIATMARRYNLHGAVIGLLILALLFVWKNATSFVPRIATAAGTVEVRGRDTVSGFTNLLRRSIRREDLLQTCLNEWHKSRRLDRRASPRRLEKVSTVVEQVNSKPGTSQVATYNEIASILNKQ